MEKFTIAAIYELDGETPKASHQFRVGRTGTMEGLRKGSRMCFKYSNRNGTLVTSPIVDHEEDGSGVYITTENSIYKMDYVKEVKDDCDETMVMSFDNL